MLQIEIPKHYEGLIHDEETIRKQLACQETNQNVDHLLSTKYITDHQVFATFIHEPNPFTGRIFTYIPFYPCQHPSETSFDRMKAQARHPRKGPLGRSLGYRLWDVDLKKYEIPVSSLYRTLTIINNPKSKQHLNYCWRLWLKSLFKGKIVNRARSDKVNKNQFIKEYSELYDKLYTYANKTLEIVSDVEKLKNEVREYHSWLEVELVKDENQTNLQEWF